MRVIVAAADPAVSEWLEGVLRSAGLTVVVLSDPSPDAPDLTGSELLIADQPSAAAVGSAGPERRLLIIPRGQAVDLTSALGGGFMDLLVVPSPEDEILSKVGRAVDHFLKPPRVVSGEDPQVQEFKDIVERVTNALRSSGPRLRGSVRELAEGMLSVFLLLVDSHETTERETPGHSRKVGPIAREIARHLGRSEEEAAWIELAGRLHDIGLLALGVQLAGESALTLDQRREVEQHPALGADILEPLKRWGLPVDAIRAHHERLDGSGYPKAVEDITLEAQILGAADVFQALTSARPWRGASSRQEAIEAMRTGRGFSTEILDALEAVTTSAIEPPGPLPTPPTEDDA